LWGIVVPATAAVLLVGCGNGETGQGGRAEATPKRTDASATPGAKPAGAPVSNAAVRADITAGMRAAGFPEPRFPSARGDGADAVCVVTTRTPTDIVPSRKDVGSLAAELKRQGWAQKIFRSEDGLTGMSMSKGKWTLQLTGGRISKEELARQLPPEQRARARALTGVYGIAVDHACTDRLYAKEREQRDAG